VAPSQGTVPFHSRGSLSYLKEGVNRGRGLSRHRAPFSRGSVLKKRWFLRIIVN